VQAQPVGAYGQELTAEFIVAVHTVVEQTVQEIVIPSFVLKSSKPIWQGMVHDSAMVLGTNAMEKYGLQTVHADGTVVPLVNSVKLMEDSNDYTVRRVLLSERIQFAPGKSWWVKVQVKQPGLQGSSPDEVQYRVFW